MKTQNLKSENISSELYGSNPPFELQTYVEVTLFISGITGEQLADKEGTGKYIISKLSENLTVSDFHIMEFEAIKMREPYDVQLRLNCTLVTGNIDRFQMNEVRDIEHEMLKKFQANAINLH